MTRVNIESLLGNYEIEMPGNGISEAGIEEIQRFLYLIGHGDIPDTIDLPGGGTEPWVWDWKVGGKGEYVGALPKRIAKYFWQTRKEKISCKNLSRIGNIGAAHSGKHAIFYFDIVNKFDWERTDFGQPDSCCFWGCHASAKDMILENGGGAIRFFSSNHRVVSNGFARAWLAPWQDCWITFNGYGLETLAIARVLAVHLDHAYYRRIGLSNRGVMDGALWINATRCTNSKGSGFLIGPQSSVLKHTSIDLRWKDTEKICSFCEEHFDSEESHSVPDNIENVCTECFYEHYFTCECCETVYCNNDGRNTDSEVYCYTCFQRHYIVCLSCGGPVMRNVAQEGYCPDCVRRRSAELSLEFGKARATEWDQTIGRSPGGEEFNAE